MDLNMFALKMTLQVAFLLKSSAANGAGLCHIQTLNAYAALLDSYKILYNDDNVFDSNLKQVLSVKSLSKSLKKSKLKKFF